MVRSDAVRITSEIAVAIADSDDATANRRFLQLADNPDAAEGATRVGLTLTEAVPPGSEPWDAALAAFSEHRLNADALPVPEKGHQANGSSRQIVDPAHERLRHLRGSDPSARGVSRPRNPFKLRYWRALSAWRPV